MKSLLIKNLFRLGLLATLSSTAFAGFGDDQAVLYCKVTCGQDNNDIGGYPSDYYDNPYFQIYGQWVQTGFATNKAQYSAMIYRCRLLKDQLLQQDGASALAAKVRYGFINKHQCSIEPYAVAKYNLFGTLHKISLVDSKE